MKISMKKSLFLTLFSLIFIFLIGLLQANAQAQFVTQCYDGTWVQPTCNPATSNPGACNILPPLFSGAACAQHSGYLRIQNEVNNPTDQAQWIELFGGTSSVTGGKILVGNVTGGWVVQSGGVEISGPVISGNFTSGAPPTGGYNSSGDIAALDSILAGGTLRVNGAGNFYGQITAYNRIVVSASVTTGALISVTNGAGSGNAATLALRQSTGDGGPILDLNTADSNNVNVDYLGYLNATKDFQVRIDSDNNSGGSPFDNKFRINNGANNPVFIVDEVGNATVANNLGVSGDETVTKSLTAGTLTTNSGGVGQGAIRGKFVESFTGNDCKNDQFLMYSTSTGSTGWYCMDKDQVGYALPTLLQVLQEGSDASAFTGTTKIGHGAGAGGVFIKASDGVTPGTLTIQTGNSNLPGVGQVFGQIGFSSGYGDLDEAKISVTRGATGSGGDYPTNMSFWTTPDGSTVAQERITILENGNVGVSTNAPNEKFEVYDNTAGTARARITDLTENPELQLQYNVGANDHWALYNNQTEDSFRVWGGGSDRVTILQSGNVGMGTAVPNQKLEINGNVNVTGLANSYMFNNRNDQGLFGNGNYSLALQTPNDITMNIDSNNNDTGAAFRINTNTTGITGGTNLMTVLESGYVGVGITPTSMFQINGASGLGWNSGLKITRADQVGADFRINVTTGDTLFRNFHAAGGFSFRNSADTTIFKLSPSSPYAVTGNFAATDATTCTNGQVLVKDASNNWICGAASSLSTPGGVNTQVQFNNNGVFGGASSLVYDNVNSRVGVGQTIPVAKLDVANNAMSGNIMRITNTGGGGSNQTNLHLQQSGGNIGNFLSMDTSVNEQDTWFDYYGYINTQGNYQIRIDTNNNGSNNFHINNGANQTIFLVNENGAVNWPANATPQLSSSDNISFLTPSISINNGVTSTLQFTPDTIIHKELDNSGTPITQWFYGASCICDREALGPDNKNSGLADNMSVPAQDNFIDIVQKKFEDIFYIKQVEAAPACFSTVAECQGYSGCTCGTDPTQCQSPDPIACHPCAGSYIQTDAVCPSGWSPTGNTVTNTCVTTNWITSIRCVQNVTGTVDYFTKLEFAGSPVQNTPRLTKVKDNLVVEQNKWGDGVTSNCAWTTGVGTQKICPINGKFVAGVDFSTNQIYCCDL